jgi:hypothetical protein
MALTYTSDELITSIRNLGMVPDTGSTASEDADILRHANEAFRTKLLPEIMRVREEYFVVSSQSTISSGTSAYRIPTRAAGNKLRDIIHVSGSQKRQMKRVAREFLHDYDSAAFNYNYYLEGNYVHLIGSSPSGSLEFAFFFRPGELVPVAQTRTITAFTAPDLFTIDSAGPTTPTAWSDSLTYDFHSSESGAEIKSWGVGITSLTGTTGQTSTAVDGTVFGTKTLAVGDRMCLAGEAVVPALPMELHPVLARAACIRIAEANGDEDMVKLHSALFKDDLKSALVLIESRIEGKPYEIDGRDGMLWVGSRLYG